MSADPADQSQNQGREPSDEDLRAAEEVLPLLEIPPEPGTQDYRDRLQTVAEHRAHMGGDAFDLCYGRRTPRNANEQAEADFYQGGSSKEEHGAYLKADAERPIDAEMLTAFCDAYEERVQAYSRMLKAVVSIATDQLDSYARQEREPEVDRHVKAMKAKFCLWKEQVVTVSKYLVDLRSARSLEPVRCRELSAETAHMLAAYAIDQAATLWRNAKTIAERSQTDLLCSDPTSASTLFYEGNLPGLPRPNELMSRINLERTAALKALRERIPATDPAEGRQQKRRPHAGGRLKSAAAKELVLDYVNNLRWNGTLQELKEALQRDTNLLLSRSTLSRYLKGLPRFIGEPHRAARRSRNEKGRDGETEAADMSGIDAYTMPDDSDDADVS